MLKKVLCVVLALVLALGTMSVVGFAATADDLAAAVAKLPDDYNAQFYNDKTVEAIADAKAAAAAASTTAEIDAAIALCDEAYELATAIDYDLYGGEYYVNRDETKAVVNYNISTDVSSVKPGDTFDVEISLSTNFYLGNAQLSLAYDSDVFSVESFSNPEDVAVIMEFLDVNPEYITKNGVAKEGFVPIEWYNELEDGRAVYEKYKVLNQVLIPTFDTEETWYPSEETLVTTITFKVNEDAADGEGKIFVDDTLQYTFFEYETDENFLENVLAFTRGVGPDLMSKDYVQMNGYPLTSGADPVDLQAQWDQTIVYGGGSVYTSTDVYGETVTVDGVELDIEIASTKPADYTALDAAVAEAAEYAAADYTADSYKALTDALAAEDALSRDLTSDDQADVDAVTNAILDAIKGLVRQQADGCPIVSVAPTADVRYNQFANLDVVVEGNPTKIRFEDSDGNTSTIARSDSIVKSIVDNGDGTETWNVSIYADKLEEVYEVYARYDETWNEVAYVFDLVAVDPDVLDDRFISYDIIDDYDGVVYQGVSTIVVKTGIDVIKVQFKQGVNTWTYSVADSPYVDEDGVRTWTLDLNLCNLGENSFDIRTRTPKTTFASTGEVMDVLVYAK